MYNTINRIKFCISYRYSDIQIFLDIQIKSFQGFFQLETTPENRTDEGLFKVFS